MLSSFVMRLAGGEGVLNSGISRTVGVILLNFEVQAVFSTLTRVLQSNLI